MRATPRRRTQRVPARCPTRAADLRTHTTSRLLLCDRLEIARDDPAVRFRHAIAAAGAEAVIRSRARETAGNGGLVFFHRLIDVLSQRVPVGSVLLECFRPGGGVAELLLLRRRAGVAAPILAAAQPAERLLRLLELPLIRLPKPLHFTVAAPPRGLTPV